MSPSTFFLVFPTFFFLIKSNPDEEIIANYCPPPSPCVINGNLTEIRYPFWRLDEDSPTVCGYPGFGIDCSGTDFPLLYLSGDTFLVKNISYEENSITLVDADVIITSNKVCPRARHNFTLTEKSPLVYNSRDLNLTFYFNCTESPFADDAYPIDCLKSDQKASYLYVGATKPYQSNRFPFCEVKVETTVMKTEGLVNDAEWWNGYLGRAMSDGFMVDWRELENCGHCAIPKGWCEQDKHLLCFAKTEP